MTHFPLFPFGIYILGLATLVALSRHQLRNPRSHGFFRFFAWVAILTLWLLKNSGSPETLFDFPELIPAFFLIPSIAFVVLGFGELWRRGRLSKQRDDVTLFAFEKTTHLVTSGIFRVVRHPVYTSLLLLAWGLWSQRPTSVGTVLSMVATCALYLTALADERECIEFFGPAYSDYMKRTWAFFPLIY